MSYTLDGDCYIPDIALPEDEVAFYGKYGMIRKQYFKECWKGKYISLLLKEKGDIYLNWFD